MNDNPPTDDDVINFKQESDELFRLVSSREFDLQKEFLNSLPPKTAANFLKLVNERFPFKNKEEAVSQGFQDVITNWLDKVKTPEYGDYVISVNRHLTDLLFAVKNNLLLIDKYFTKYANKSIQGKTAHVIITSYMKTTAGLVMEINEKIMEMPSIVHEKTIEQNDSLQICISELFKACGHETEFLLVLTRFQEKIDSMVGFPMYEIVSFDKSEKDNSYLNIKKIKKE